MKWENMKKTKIKKKTNFIKFIKEWISIFASLLAILGFGLISIINQFGSEIPIIKNNKYENKIEKIKVSENSEYVKSILGNPQLSKEYIYYTNSNEEIEGERCIYVNDYFILILYYEQDDSLLGYVLISKNEKFTPYVYRDITLKDKVKDIYKTTGGYMVSIYHNQGSRKDCSQTHIQFYYHHLATNSCRIGVGISDLGYWNNEMNNLIYKYWENSREYKRLTLYENIEFESLKSNIDIYSNIQPNVFSVFIDDDVDLNKLFEQEFAEGIVFTHLTYSRIED